ncbi:hypothetical protein DERP_005328 [Dermatophagoides pteronyssinus]|uniref:Uncharacterized protein n=1 Tax=Dermatophagoides pteronyssinus TaxID=6956 RepID=A0ABQ8JMU1_DERPT|nr:hypothetical protein DERP_005328 [Dermatophagoides pteronyssinus]
MDGSIGSGLFKLSTILFNISDSICCCFDDDDDDDDDVDVNDCIDDDNDDDEIEFNIDCDDDAPDNVCKHCPVFISQTRTVESALPDTIEPDITILSIDNCDDQTPPVCPANVRSFVVVAVVNDNDDDEQLELLLLLAKFDELIDLLFAHNACCTLLSFCMELLLLLLLFSRG